MPELTEEPRRSEYQGVAADRGMRRGATEGVKPKGGKPGERVVQGSKVDPQRWPEAGKDRKADVTIHRGNMRKRVMRDVPMDRVNALIQRQASNKVRAVARDAMSQDVVAQSFAVRKIGKPERWTYLSSV